MKPSSAILLAAGRGRRQRPFTDDTPKPLLKTNGRATLDYVLTAVARARVKRICIVTHYLEEKIRDYVGNGSDWKLDVTFVHQNELRGSGDALLSVPPEWIQAEPLMVAATDYILKENVLLDLVKSHEQRRADITMSLKKCPVDELMQRSSVAVDPDWRVRRIIEKPKRSEILGPYAASFMYIFPHSIWNYLPRLEPSLRGELELPQAVQMMIEEGYRTYGLLQPAPEEWTPNSIDAPLVE